VILINDKLHDVPGIRTLAPIGEPWNRLVRGQKRTRRVQYAIIHKTIADDPEKLLGGSPPTDRWSGAKDTILYWQEHKNARTGKLEPLSGTHLVTGHNGDTCCTADLATFVGWHAGAKDADANPLSYGHEIKEVYGGGVYPSALAACVAVTKVATSALGIQQQCPTHYKNNRPNPRFRDGGKGIIGVHGHRDVTEQRGYWDPGDIIFDMLEAEGFERFDFYAGQDLDVWSRRQEWLRELGCYHGAIDGIAGADTTTALKQLGFPGGIFARWRDLAELPPMPPGWERP
jgi:hypothetical protein